jgi:hypothetical protein
MSIRPSRSPGTAHTTNSFIHKNHTPPTPYDGRDGYGQPTSTPSFDLSYVSWNLLWSVPLIPVALAKTNYTFWRNHDQSTSIGKHLHSVNRPYRFNHRHCMYRSGSYQLALNLRLQAQLYCYEEYLEVGSLMRRTPDRLSIHKEIRKVCIKRRMI